VTEFTFWPTALRQKGLASKKAIESVVSTIDYIITFVGMCIALACVAYVFGWSLA
jgi:hypothetical protein